jgi:hypothetical protein
MAAYLAYGAETLGGLRVGGILSPDLGGWPPLQALEAPVSAAVWLAPGASGQGRPWPGPGLGVY